MLLACAIGGSLTLYASANPPATRSDMASTSSPAATLKRTTTRSKITPGGRRAIDQGTAWLLTCIRRDGFVGTDRDTPPDLGCTAMVGLALLSQGNTPRAGKHSAELRKILDAVLTGVETGIPENGPIAGNQTLLQRKIGQHAHVFLAALFLSQVHGESPHAREDVRKALEKLVFHISRSQRPNGTWGEESWAPVLGTVLGWLSLRASSASGLKIDASSTKTGEALAKKLQAETVDKQSWMHAFYKDVASIRVLYSLKYRDSAVFQESVQRVMKLVEEDSRPFVQAGGEEYLALYLVTECMLKERGPTWERWYPTVSRQLVRVQNRDGSWSGHHCITHRTFCTAAALMTLQTPNLFLPVSDL